MARWWAARAVLAVAIAGLAAPACALAEQRHASPTGSGVACSQPAPCSLVTAVNGASPGDEVIVAGDQGPYGTPSPITTTLKDAGSVKLHGAAGQPMPVVYSSAAGYAIEFNGGGTISDLDVEEVNTGATAVFLGTGADHLIARGGISGCTPAPSVVLIDSVCAGADAGISASSATGGTLTMTLRNVTAIATTAGSAISLGASSYNQIVNATNVIARSPGTNVQTFQFSGGAITFNLDHSNYATTSPAAGTTITPAGSGTNQTAAPVFVNSAAGEFHQAPASPTIDQGADNSLNGLTDVEGKPRVFGAHTDIGADEYAPPSVLGESASSVSNQSAVLSANVNGEGAPAGVRIEYGPTAAYGASVATATPAPSASLQLVSATVGGLSPATTYHFRVVVSNPSGTTAGADQTFTTAGSVLAGIVPTLPTPATISALAETNATFAVAPASTPLTGMTAGRRHKRGTVFSFRLDRPATVKIAIQGTTAGRRVGHSCRSDSHGLRRRPRCTRTVLIATLTRTAHAGLNKVAFSGRIRGHALKPGRYRAVFTATDAAGSSPPGALSFTIVRR